MSKRSSSEPNPVTNENTNSVNIDIPTRAITTGSTTPQIIQEKLRTFNENLEKYLSEINFASDNDVLEVKADDFDLLVRYKIGRFNPPHKGHIELFMRNIREMAKANSTLQTKVIIFAGNGAKSEPKSKNPLNFQTKKEVIKYLLQKEMPNVNIDDIVEIREKDYKDESGENITPVTQLTSFVSSYPNQSNMASTTTQLAVGDKDDDAAKLGFMNIALNKYFEETYPNLKFTSEIIPMSAVILEAPGGGGAVQEQEQSATLIRKIATDTDSFEAFNEQVIKKTGLDYGDTAQIVWNAIKEANAETEQAAQAIPEKRRRIGIGGSRRSKKNYKTKRRKNRRNKSRKRKGR
jgi:phosphopantetheine adenylyltransferase